MLLEKEISKMRWYAYKDVKYKTMTVSETSFMIWVSKHGYNLALAMELCDFSIRCEDDCTTITADNSWSDHTGFMSSNNNEAFIIEYIHKFISKWEIEPCYLDHCFLEHEWYHN